MHHEALLSLGLLVIVTKLLEGIFRRLRLNAIVAYASAGILLGPVLDLTGLWSIHSTGHIELLLTLGIFIFFFLIGIDEIDISSFMATLRGHYFLTAVLSVILSMGIALLVTTPYVYDFGLSLSFSESLALAGVLSMPSLGIVAKVLADEGRLREPLGLQIFTVVVIAELITLLIIGFSIGEHANELTVTGILILLGKIAGFAIVSWILASRVLPPMVSLLRRLIQVPQLSLGVLIGVLFLMVFGAEQMGLHGSLGALLFGASLSGLSYQARKEIIPGLRSVAEAFFVPLFFASAGLQFSFTFVTLPVWSMVALALVPLCGNFIGAFIGAYVARLTVPYAVASGLMGKGVAEIALLLVLWESGTINEVVFSFLVLVMFCYILFMPPVISLAVGKASQKQDLPATLDDIPAGLIGFALDDVTVDKILDRAGAHPDATVSVRDFMERWTTPHQHDYVVANQDSVAGIVSVELFRYLPKSEWGRTPLSSVLRSGMTTAWSDEPVEDVLHRMSEHAVSVVPVLERETEKFLGSITRNDIVELMTMEATGGH